MRVMRWSCLALIVMLAAAVVLAEKPDTDVKKLPRITLELGQGVKMDCVLLPAGKFMMGSLTTESGHKKNEGPYHEVTLTKPFYMGVTEVTQRQFEVIMGKNRSHRKGEKHPVEFHSWNRAVKFCEQLSAKTGKKVRLPTEAEWEYACRAGTTTPWSFGDNEKQMGYYAWYKGNASGGHHPVGQKKPNAWGLYDMHGNVWELVHDRHSSKYNPNDAVDPTGSSVRVAIRVMRGGSYNYSGNNLRSARRLAIGSTITLFETGFRVVVEKE